MVKERKFLFFFSLWQYEIVFSFLHKWLCNILAILFFSWINLWSVISKVDTKLFFGKRNLVFTFWSVSRWSVGRLSDGHFFLCYLFCVGFLCTCKWLGPLVGLLVRLSIWVLWLFYVTAPVWLKSICLGRVSILEFHTCRLSSEWGLIFVCVWCVLYVSLLVQCVSAVRQCSALVHCISVRT